MFSLLVLCAAAGLVAAVAVAGTSGTAIGATETTAPPPTTTTPPPTTTAPPPTTTAPPPTTTAPPPPPPPPPPPAGIAAGDTIAGIPVGGLTPDAALALVRSRFAARLPIRIAGRRLEPTPQALGAVAYAQNAVAKARVARPRTSVPLTVRVDGRKVRAYVEKLALRFDRRPVDSRLLLRNLRPFVTRDAAGRSLDRAAATTAIVGALRANSRAPLALTVRLQPASVSRRSFGSIIVIRRGSNRLFLYDGMRLRRTFGVATGQARYPTPLGRFRIVVKWTNPWWYPPDSDWAKGQKPVPPGPTNPLGTRWMGLDAPGVGIHGTPEPGSIGYSVSHGCIRLAIPNAEWLFERVSIGTPVFIVRQ